MLLLDSKGLFTIQSKKLLTGFYKINIKNISYFNFKTSKIIFFVIFWSFLCFKIKPKSPIFFLNANCPPPPPPANYKTTKMLDLKFRIS